MVGDGDNPQGVWETIMLYIDEDEGDKREIARRVLANLKIFRDRGDKTDLGDLRVDCRLDPEDLEFLKNDELIEFTPTNLSDPFVQITADGLAWLEIDQAGNFSEELVEASLLQVLGKNKAKAFRCAEALKELRTHHSSLRLATRQQLDEAVTFLNGEGFVDLNARSGSGNPLFVWHAQITSRGVKKLRGYTEVTAMTQNNYYFNGDGCQININNGIQQYFSQTQQAIQQSELSNLDKEELSSLLRLANVALEKHDKENAKTVMNWIKARLDTLKTVVDYSEAALKAGAAGAVLYHGLLKITACLAAL